MPHITQIAKEFKARYAQEVIALPDSHDLWLFVPLFYCTQSTDTYITTALPKPKNNKWQTIVYTSHPIAVANLKPDEKPVVRYKENDIPLIKYSLDVSNYPVSAYGLFQICTWTTIYYNRLA